MSTVDKTSEKIYYPTLKEWMIFFGLCIVGLSLYFLTDPTIEYLFPEPNENATLAELQEETIRINIFTIFLTAVGTIFYIFLAGYFYILGRKIISSREFPPEWSLNIILVKTKVKTGRYAYAMGIGCYIFSGIFILQILFSLHILWTVIKYI